MKDKGLCAWLVLFCVHRNLDMTLIHSVACDRPVLFGELLNQAGRALCSSMSVLFLQYTPRWPQDPETGPSL